MSVDKPSSRYDDYRILRVLGEGFDTNISYFEFYGHRDSNSLTSDEYGWSRTDVSINVIVEKINYNWTQELSDTGIREWFIIL